RDEGRQSPARRGAVNSTGADPMQAGAMERAPLLVLADRARSVLVLVVPAPPGAVGLVAPLRCAVEPLEHAPKAVQSARECGIRLVYGSVLEHERAHAGPLARVRGGVCPARLRVDTGSPPAEGGLAPVVVLDASLALLLLGEPDTEVVVEVASVRGRPGERPSHPPLVRLELLVRRARDRPEHHVMVGQVRGEPVEAVGDRRAGRAAGGVIGPEHEVVDEELRAPAEKVRQRGAPFAGLESILLVDPNPR